MLKSAIKNNCKSLSQHRVLNEPHFETWTRHEPEITSPKLQARTRNLILKPDLRPEAKFTEWVEICATAGIGGVAK